MRNAYCSFCRKSYQEVGPLVEGPDNVFICAECVDLTRRIMDQEILRRSSGDSAEYLLKKIDRMARSVEEEAVTLDPRMSQLIDAGSRQVDPGLFQSVYDLCRATALLAIVGGSLERLRTMTLKDTERALLQDIEANVTQMRTVLDMRARERKPA